MRYVFAGNITRSYSRVQQIFFEKRAGFLRHGRNRKIKAFVIRLQRADKFHLNSVDCARIERKKPRAKKHICILDQKQMYRRFAVARDAEHPFVKRGKLSVAASGAFRKNKHYSSIRQMFFYRFQIIDHCRSHHFIGRGGDIAGVFQKPAEDRNLKESAFDNSNLPRKKRNKQNGIEIR